METEEEKKNSLKPLSHGRRSAKFFDITGHSLVHPMSYQMKGFQKQIIITAIFRNTLISLPPGLGMPYLASVIIFNFQRWFLNGRIVVLSQTKSCIVEQINALNSYTTLCKESFSDLYGNTTKVDDDAAWNKPIILSSPSRFLDSIQNNVCKVDNLVLLIVYETSKVTKCQEYKDIMTLLTGLDFRVDVFIEGGGFNAKSLNQIIETFNISQIEFRNMSSEDIKGCTFHSEIESVSLEISPHMISIKDAFYAVYEKYGKLLKDARVINGNVASFTKNLVQKAREKLMKTPPQNMDKETLQNLFDGMTMCSFLCVGIEILHNWGIRSFYNYLFDENKDSELKRLIVKDDHLKNQMKLLNEYLKSNGKKMESLMSRIVHPKLIYLKNLILRSFSESEGIIDDFRMVIFCSMDEIIDDIDRLVSSLPNFIRHQCARTKSKSFSNTNEYKEVVENFNSGVINVLVVNNLVEEIHELGTNILVSLEPNKTLVKFSDPRFHRGPDKCFFVLTNGVEYQKFEALLNEKKNEQKSIELPQVDHILQNSPNLFPEGFNPDFESTSVGSSARNQDQSVGQKSIVNYLKSENEGKSRKSINIFDDSDFIDSSVFVPKTAQRRLPSLECSPPFPLFNSKLKTPVKDTSSKVQNEINEDDLYDPFYTSPQPVPFTEQLGYSNASKENDDSAYDLILDFAVPPRNKEPDKPRKIEEPVKSCPKDEEDLDLIICEKENDKLSKCDNDMNHNKFKAPEIAKVPLLMALQSLRDRAAKLPLDLDASLSSDSVPNSEPTSPKSKSRLAFDVDDLFDDFNSTELQNEMFKEITVPGGSKDDPQSSKFRPSIDMVDETRQNSPMLKKNTLREDSLFDSSKGESRLSRNSRTSIDVVYDTGQNPTLKRNSTFKETSLFDRSKDESRFNKTSRSSIDVVYDTGQNPYMAQRTINKENTLFGSSKDDSRMSENSRTSIDFVYDTGQNPTLKRNSTFKETSLFDSSKDESRLSKTSRSSIDVVYDTGRNPIMAQKTINKENTLFGSFKDDSRPSGNSRSSIDVVNKTPRVQTTMKKFIFKEKTLFGSCKDDSRSSKNSGTSIDMVNDTGQDAINLEKSIFKGRTLFDSSKDDTRSCENSRTNANFVNDTMPIPASTKSPIFSTKKSNITLSKNTHIPLKDQSASIHFGSSFELDDDFLLLDFNPDASKTTTVEKKPEEHSPKNKPDKLNQSDDSSEENYITDEKPPDVANIDDWDPDCELFQDEDSLDNAVVDNVTPQKNPITAKTSTPIDNPRVSPVVENHPIVDLVSPPKKLENKTDRLECANPPSVTSLTSTELPKPNRSLKKPSNTCDTIINTDNCRKKAITNSFFANFTLSLNQRSLERQNTQNSSTSAKYSKIDDDNDHFPWMKGKTKPPERAKLKTNPDDDVVYPWMKKSPVKRPPSSFGPSCSRESPIQLVPLPKSNSPTASVSFTSSSTDNRISSSSPSIAHSTPDFKKPGPFIIRSSTSKSAQSSSGSDQKSISGESPSEAPGWVKKKKKKTNLKRNLAKQFLDNEAEVSSDGSDDTIVDDSSNQSYENDSFIDDEITDKKINNYSHYLKSIKSPGRIPGKFRIPVLSESKLRMNVFSQMDYFDQTYQQDSFCVDDIDTLDEDPEYAPSVLTQMEDRLKFEKKKPKRLPAVSSSEESSNEENSGKSAVRHKKKHRKRIMCFSSSDEEDRAK